LKYADHEESSAFAPNILTFVRSADFHEGKALYSAIRKILVTRFYATVLSAVIEMCKVLYREEDCTCNKE